MSAGNLKTTTSVPARNESTVRLSNSSPKNAFRSPSVNHSYRLEAFAMLVPDFVESGGQPDLSGADCSRGSCLTRTERQCTVTGRRRIRRELHEKAVDDRAGGGARSRVGLHAGSRAPWSQPVRHEQGHGTEG